MPHLSTHSLSRRPLRAVLPAALCCTAGLALLSGATLAAQKGAEQEAARSAEDAARQQAEVDRLRAAVHDLEHKLDVQGEELRRSLAAAEQALSESVRAAERAAPRDRIDLERAMRDLDRARVEADRARASEARTRALALRESRPLLALLNDRPRLGITVRDAPAEDGKGAGARVESVRSGSPAAEAGLEVGDVIVRFGELDLGEAEDSQMPRSPGGGSFLEAANGGPAARLVDAVREAAEGVAVEMTVLRGSEEMTLEVTPRPLEPVGGLLAAAARAPGAPRPPLVAPVDRLVPKPPSAGRPPRPEAPLPDAPMVHFFGGGVWHDLQSVPISAELGAYFGVDHGLLVLEPPSDGVVELKAGDVILQIGGRSPTDVRHAMRILSSYESGETLEVEVMRQKKRLTLRGALPERGDGLFWNGAAAFVPSWPESSLFPQWGRQQVPAPESLLRERVL